MRSKTHWFDIFSFQQYKLPKEEIEEHLKKMVQEIKARGKFVLCHCDFHIRNIVYDEDTGMYKMIIFVSRGPIYKDGLTHWGRVTSDMRQ